MGSLLRTYLLSRSSERVGAKYNSHVIIMSNVKMNNHELKAVLETVRVL